MRSSLVSESVEETSRLVGSEEAVSECTSCPAYYGGFIACLVLLILTICITVPYIVYLRKLITHIDKQLSSPDLYDYRKDGKFLDKQIVQQKDVNSCDESHTAERHSLLQDVDMEQYQCILENTGDLNERLTSVLQEEKTKYQDEIAEIRADFEAELESLEETSQKKKLELENSRNFELQALEDQYEEEFSAPTLIFWEKIKEILDKAKVFNKELIEEKHAHWLYDARVSDDAKRLQEKVDEVRVNKGFIGKVTIAIKEHLTQWPNLMVSMKETRISSSIVEQLFTLLELLIIAHQSNTELIYDRRIREQDNKYLSDSEEQQRELSEICSSLVSNIKEEKEQLIEKMSKDLESKIPWTNKYINEVDNLYSVREQLLDAKLEFEIKKAEDNYSEVRLKLLHLDAILEIQEEYMMNLEKVAEISVESLNLCTKTLRLGAYDEADNKKIEKSASRPRDMFMDRYAQA